jgi:hypothetical protein
MRLRHFAAVACVLSASILSTGCALTAPAYSISVSDVEQLKSAGDTQVSVGAFSPGKDSHDGGITVRAAVANSPVGGSYAAYLADALKQELALAKKLGPDAEIEVSGVLTKNDLSAASFDTGTGDIEAHFVVKRKGLVIYDEVKSNHIEFASSFLGSVAIPHAVAAYPGMVQGLLTNLCNDPDFIAALK